MNNELRILAGAIATATTLFAHAAPPAADSYAAYLAQSAQRQPIQPDAATIAKQDEAFDREIKRRYAQMVLGPDRPALRNPRIALEEMLEGRRASNAWSYVRYRNSCGQSETGTYNADCGSEAPRAAAAYGRRSVELIAWERRGGAASTQQLRNSDLDSITPNSIPGGWLVPTTRVLDYFRGKVGFRLIDVAGASATLPDAIAAPWAGEPGTFEDATQRRMSDLLREATGGNPGTLVVFYSRGPDDWRSYNAALRAIALGYPYVGWYRGGLQGWKVAGLPLAGEHRGARIDTSKLVPRFGKDLDALAMR